MGVTCLRPVAGKTGGGIRAQAHLGAADGVGHPGVPEIPGGGKCRASCLVRLTESALHHCDKTPEETNLEEGKARASSRARSVLGPVVSQSTRWEQAAQSTVAGKHPLQGHTPMT